jgi:hypothetical protein
LRQQRIIAHYRLYAEARDRLRDPHTRIVDIKALVRKAEGAARLARWLIRLRIPLQFNLAGELLYGAESMQEAMGVG